MVQHRANSNGSISLPSPAQSPAQGMSAQSRYNHNLKVLRRRDPSIVSIFDQFSHVCVYHHDGTRWEKQGYEGTMFLYERDSYPPYGFYILNRVGMDDYIQRLYPEDSMQAHDKYLMMRSYPAFTTRRLEAISHLSPPSHKFASEWTMGLRGDGGRELEDKEKGQNVTFGLWCFATDARDPMQDVMIRLHSYIKQNQPYPDIYKYGPDRTPSTPAPAHAHAHSPLSNNISRAEQSTGSSLDALFSKIGGGSASGAALGGQQLSTSSPAPSQTPSRGLALLDSIFASANTASPSPSPALPNPHPPSRHNSTGTGHSQPNGILSPKPTNGAMGGMQVLTPEVISSLMGLTPSPTPSSPRGAAGMYRYDASDEESWSEDRDGDAMSVSSTSTVLDPEVIDEGMIAEAGTVMPLLSVPHGSAGGGGAVWGDRTPRAVVRGMQEEDEDDCVGGAVRTSTPPMMERGGKKGRDRTGTATQAQYSLVVPSAAGSHASREELSRGLMKSSSSSTIKAHFQPPQPQPQPSVQAKSKNSSRPLVPFTADSELWPYPGPHKHNRGVVDDGSSEGGDDGVVELDWKDIGRLNDLSMNGASVGQKGKGKKKGKKERAEERERERDAIEQSWDTPAPPTVNGKGKAKASPAGIDADAVKGALVSGLEASGKGGSFVGMQRNDFVREVLTLIHTDKGFVEQLWKEYMARAE